MLQSEHRYVCRVVSCYQEVSREALCTLALPVYTGTGDHHKVDSVVLFLYTQNILMPLHLGWH